jgi:hypothetical protein
MHIATCCYFIHQTHGTQLYRSCQCCCQCGPCTRNVKSVYSGSAATSRKQTKLREEIFHQSNNMQKPIIQHRHSVRKIKISCLFAGAWLMTYSDKSLQPCTSRQHDEALGRRAIVQPLLCTQIQCQEESRNMRTTNEQHIHHRIFMTIMQLFTECNSAKAMTNLDCCQVAGQLVRRGFNECVDNGIIRFGPMLLCYDKLS